MRPSRNARLFVSGAACVAVVAAAGLSVSGGAVAGSPPDLAVHYFFEDGKLSPLRIGVTYQASKLPLALRVTPPTGKWGGTQWKANGFSPVEIQRRHLRCPAACKPPYFGWAIVGQAGSAATSGIPRGIVLVMAGYSRTPSVAATVNSLRTRGQGATYEPTSTVKVGGFSGIQFDGQVTAALHRFVPFSPPTTGAASFPDEIDVHGAGHRFRFTVLDVRSKTVIIFVGTEALAADQFTVFLKEAGAVVASLKFRS
ncbi:MAG: hypothetical protein ACJ76I_00065 [Gaiellaceae bacterium]